MVFVHILCPYPFGAARRTANTRWATLDHVNVYTFTNKCVKHMHTHCYTYATHVYVHTKRRKAVFGSCRVWLYCRCVPYTLYYVYTGETVEWKSNNSHDCCWCVSCTTTCEHHMHEEQKGERVTNTQLFVLGEAHPAECSDVEQRTNSRTNA